jgi:amino acid transporter
MLNPGAPAVNRIEYVAVSVGMALSVSNYGLVAELFRHGATSTVLVAVSVAGALCVVIAGAIGEVSSRFPSAPGMRTYLRAGIGNRVSLLGTFALLAVVVLFGGVEAQMLLASVRAAVGDVSPGLVFAGAIGIPVALNLVGLEVPRLAQLVVCAVLLGGTLLLAAGGIMGAPAAAQATTPGPLLDVGLVGMSFFLYMGFEWVAPLGRTPAAYQKAIPTAMTIAVLILVGTYVSLCVALARRLGPGVAGLSPVPHVVLSQATLGRVGSAGALLLTCAATFTTFNAGLLGAGRLIYALGREAALPKAVTRVGARTGVPYVAIASVGACAAATAWIMLATDTAIPAALACAAIYSLVYALLLVAAVALRRREGVPAARFLSRLPSWAYLSVAALVALFGAAAPLGDPEARRGALVTCAAVLLGSGGLALRAASGQRRTSRPSIAELKQVESAGAGRVP